MFAELAASIVDESKWLPMAMGAALVSVTAMIYRHRRAKLPSRRRILAAMNLFFAVTISTMAFGHLLAVTVRLAAGTLRGGVSIPLLYLIGVALAVPSGWLLRHTRRLLEPGDGHGRATVALNAWLGMTLVALGLHNLPLAAPALVNIGYHLHSRRAVGWAIVAVAVAFQVGLFTGALIFMASGQTFEQFRGIE